MRLNSAQYKQKSDKNVYLNHMNGFLFLPYLPYLKHEYRKEVTNISESSFIWQIGEIY